MSRYTRRSSSHGTGLALLLIVLFAVPFYLWSGFVLETIWNWFVPSIFTSVPRLNLAQAIGIGLVVSLFTHRGTPSSDEDDSAILAVLKQTLEVLLYGFIVLALGAIVHSFI